MSYYTEVRRADLDMDGKALMVEGVDKTAVLEKSRIVWSFHVPGTLAANVNIRYAVPVDCRLSHISAVTSNNSDATLKFGISSDDDSILAATTIGDSNVPVEFDEWAAANPTGALNAGEIAVLTVDYDGGSGTAAADLTVVITADPV